MQRGYRAAVWSRARLFRWSEFQDFQLLTSPEESRFTRAQRRCSGHPSRLRGQSIDSKDYWAKVKAEWAKMDPRSRAAFEELAEEEAANMVSRAQVVMFKASSKQTRNN